MLVKKDPKEVDKQLNEERNRIARYRELFGSDLGKTVLQDMKEKFLYQDSRSHVAHGNQLGVVFIDGQRMLMRALINWIETDTDEYMSAFSKPLTIEEGDPLYAGESTEPGHYF